MKDLIKFLAFSIFLTNSSFLLAETTGYEVEVIIFSYNNNQYSNSEKWPETKPIDSVNTADRASSSSPNTDNENSTPDKPTSPDIENETRSTEKEAATLIDLTKQASFLSHDQYRLNSQEQKMLKQKHYNLLLHKAWKQAGLAENKTFPIHIDSRLTDDNKSTIDKNITTDNSTRSKENKGEYISGDITLIMSRYLHIKTNLLLHESEITSNTETSEYNSSTDKPEEKLYAINLERRMKSREIHFIDHPLIGIIVLAIPFEIPDITRAEQSQKYKTL